MSVDFFTCRSYKFSRTCSSKSLPRAHNVFPCLIEHLEIVVVQLDTKQITQVHRVPLGLIDAEEQKYLEQYLRARTHWTFVFVLRFSQEIDLSPEYNLHDSFDNL